MAAAGGRTRSRPYSAQRFSPCWRWPPASRETALPSPPATSGSSRRSRSACGRDRRTSCSSGCRAGCRGTRCPRGARNVGRSSRRARHRTSSQARRVRRLPCAPPAGRGSGSRERSSRGRRSRGTRARAHRHARGCPAGWRAGSHRRCRLYSVWTWRWVNGMLSLLPVFLL